MFPFGLPRLKFPKGEQRRFLKGIFETSGLNADGLAKIIDVSPRTNRDWKREKFCISKTSIKIFCSTYRIPHPAQEAKKIENWRKMKLETCRKGGFAHLWKYGSPGTPEGRSKGGRIALRILRERGVIPIAKQFNFPQNYSSELAEWTGLVLGDGGITKDQVRITLNMNKDANYRIFVSNLGKKLFGETPTIAFRPENNVSISYYSGLKLIEYLKKIGLKVGNKVKQQVKVPSWILENDAYSTSCLRGLIDTDGCIATHSYFVNGKRYTYKKLVFANRSIPLINFVYEHLNKLGLGAKIADRLETKYVWLYNCSRTKKYLDIVGSHNKRILTQGG